MNTIEVTGLRRIETGYTELSFQFRFPLPSIYLVNGNPINGLAIIIGSYPDGFYLDADGQTPILSFGETKSIEEGTTLNQIKNYLLSRYNAMQTKLNSLTLKPYDQIAGLIYNGSSWI